MTRWDSPPFPRIIRISKDDGTEEETDFYRALRLLRDAYPGFESDAEIVEALQSGAALQTMFAYYRVKS